MYSIYVSVNGWAVSITSHDITISPRTKTNKNQIISSHTAPNHESTRTTHVYPCPLFPIHFQSLVVSDFLVSIAGASGRPAPNTPRTIYCSFLFAPGLDQKYGHWLGDPPQNIERYCNILAVLPRPVDSPLTKGTFSSVSCGHRDRSCPSLDFFSILAVSMIWDHIPYPFPVLGCVLLQALSRFCLWKACTKQPQSLINHDKS